MKEVWIAVSIFVIFVNGEPDSASSQTCDVSIKEPSELLPLLLKADNTDFILPDNNGHISFKTGEEFLVACPQLLGITNSNQVMDSGKLTAKVACQSEQEFVIDGTTHKFSDILCARPVHHASRRAGNCFEGISRMEMGFQVEEKFHQLITVCYDEHSGNTIYTNHTVLSSVGGSQKTSAPLEFKETGYYKKKVQSETLLKILGSEKIVAKYIKDNSYLSRNQLSPSEDFIYDSQKHASFYTINGIPQWKPINLGNWKSLEESIRNVSIDRQLHLTIYTGTHGAIKLSDKRGIKRKIYLAVDKNSKYKFPVPSLIWKVVYDPTSQKGIAFVSVNNPYIKGLSTENTICHDVCENLSWLKFNGKNFSLGYIYCCDVSELRKTVTVLPNFIVNEIFT